MTANTTPDAEMPDELPLTEAEVLDIMQQFDMGGSSAVHEIDFRKLINQASLAVKLARPSPSVERMPVISDDLLRDISYLEGLSLLKDGYANRESQREWQIARRIAALAGLEKIGGVV